MIAFEIRRWFLAVLVLSTTMVIGPGVSAEPAQDAARAAFVRIFTSWSQENSKAMDDIGALYAETVSYYGKSVGRSDVLADKQRFAARWPVRAYAPVTSAIDVQCAPAGDICTVRAPVDWRVSSADGVRSRTGRMAASFVLQRRAGGDWRITGEVTTTAPQDVSTTAPPSAKDTCEGDFRNQAEYRSCLADKGKRETAPLVSKACSSTSCLYRLRCRADGNGQLCDGDDWRAEIQPTDQGVDIFITGADGRVTKFNQCGTCSNAEYEFGPQKGASIQRVEDAVVLRIETASQ